jgi:hypothetical protein
VPGQKLAVPGRRPGMPSPSYATTFNSVLHTGDKDTMVRVTKTKQNWTSSAHKKIIGNGEQLRRLYGSSRK